VTTVFFSGDDEQALWRAVVPDELCALTVARARGSSNKRATHLTSP